jgi:small subunit ribosomal protein S17
MSDETENQETVSEETEDQASAAVDTTPATDAPVDTTPAIDAPVDVAPAGAAVDVASIEAAVDAAPPEAAAPAEVAVDVASIEVAADPSDEAPAKRVNARKVREGLVVSISMDKTAIVATVDRVRHRRYVKTVQRTKRLYAHDENNETRIGDRVRVAETRPLSKLKRWRVVEILERAK